MKPGNLRELPYRLLAEAGDAAVDLVPGIRGGDLLVSERGIVGAILGHALLVPKADLQQQRGSSGGAAAKQVTGRGAGACSAEAGRA